MSNTTCQIFAVNWSINCAEIDEFDYVESLHYKVWQSLLQTEVRITKWSNYIKKCGQYYMKIGQSSFALLQGGAIVITKRGTFIIEWTRFSNMRQELIKRGASNLLQCWLIVIANWDNYYKESQYTFATPWRMQSHIYW